MMESNGGDELLKKILFYEVRLILSNEWREQNRKDIDLR
jgi:hypothetical protein